MKKLVLVAVVLGACSSAHAHVTGSASRYYKTGPYCVQAIVRAGAFRKANVEKVVLELAQTDTSYSVVSCEKAGSD